MSHAICSNSRQPLTICTPMLNHAIRYSLYVREKYMLRTIEKLANRINLVLGRTFAWLSLGMVMLMFINVLMRYVFHSASVWQQELVQFSFAILLLTTSGYTLFSDKHVRVDIFYQSLRKRHKAWINLVGSIVFLIPMALAIGYFSYDFILSSWQIKESSTEYNGMPGVYLLKTCLWVFTFTLLVQGTAIICKSLRHIL